MMDELLKYLPLLNVFVLPGLAIMWQAAQEVAKLRAFMEESKADREKLHRQVDRIERELLTKGFINGNAAT